MDPINRIAPPLPGRAVLAQALHDIVFIHWRVKPAEVAPFLPPGIAPDVFDGSSWVGLIPFGMRDTSVLGGPPVPYFGTFTEVNVRLYGIDSHGRRGVVFLSLDASRLAAVVTARTLFGLPYFWAKASASTTEGLLSYRTRRRATGSSSSLIVARPTTNPVSDDPLADFLAARWLLFATSAGHTIAMPNEHEPWPLFEAELVELRDELVAASGVTSVGAREPDSVLYSPGVLARFGKPERLD